MLGVGLEAPRPVIVVYSEYARTLISLSIPSSHYYRVGGPPKV